MKRLARMEKILVDVSRQLGIPLPERKYKVEDLAEYMDDFPQVEAKVRKDKTLTKPERVMRTLFCPESDNDFRRSATTSYGGLSFGFYIKPEFDYNTGQFPNFDEVIKSESYGEVLLIQPDENDGVELEISEKKIIDLGCSGKEWLASSDEYQDFYKAFNDLKHLHGMEFNDLIVRNILLQLLTPFGSAQS